MSKKNFPDQNKSYDFSIGFKAKYKRDVVPMLQKQFGYGNVHEIPKIVKIVLNMGVGEVTDTSKAITGAVNDLTLISGQKPIITKAKKSIAGFKLREGMSIGCKVTLRQDRMFDFLERLVIVGLPRIKQFPGLSSRNFDGKGNLNFGIKEQVVFPEISYDKIDMIRGLNVTIVTTANTNDEAKALLEGFDIPFYN